jgi:hypothetical protein
LDLCQSAQYALASLTRLPVLASTSTSISLAAAAVPCAKEYQRCTRRPHVQHPQAPPEARSPAPFAA